MSTTPIFDQLLGEFIEQGRYGRVLIGPPAPPAPRMYIVEDLPKLVVKLDDTITFPPFKDEIPNPPSFARDTTPTKVIPVVEDNHVFPIKKAKSQHKKSSPTSTLGWFSRAA